MQAPLGLVGQYGGDSGNDDDGSGASDAAPEPAAVASSTARAIRQAADERRAAAEAARAAAAARSKVLKADPALARFETHSRGIGSKLLKMMGWKPGEGVGAKRDGMSKPIEVELRPKLAGLGAANEKAEGEKGAAAAAPGKGKAAAQAAKSEASAFKEAWRARSRKGARSKEVFKSADDVLLDEPAGGGGGGGGGGLTILDMTGPQTRVVTDAAQLAGGGGGGASSAAAGDAAGPFPELQHNLKLLVDLAEADIRALDGRLGHERDTAVLLAEEEARLRASVARVDGELARACQVRARWLARCGVAAVRAASLSGRICGSGHLCAWRPLRTAPDSSELWPMRGCAKPQARVCGVRAV